MVFWSHQLGNYYVKFESAVHTCLPLNKAQPHIPTIHTTFWRYFCLFMFTFLKLFLPLYVHFFESIFCPFMFTFLGVSLCVYFCFFRGIYVNLCITSIFASLFSLFLGYFCLFISAFLRVFLLLICVFCGEKFCFFGTIFTPFFGWR